jgi:uncharacterized membrane protein YeiH
MTRILVGGGAVLDALLSGASLVSVQEPSGYMSVLLTSLTIAATLTFTVARTALQSLNGPDVLHPKA